MNKCNDWKDLLRICNEDLKTQDLEKSGYSLRIVKSGEGYYSCEVLKNGKFIDAYAENYREDELSDLITDAFHHINTLIWQDSRSHSRKLKTMIVSEEYQKTGQTLVSRIELVLLHYKVSRPYGIRERESDAELVGEMKSLLEEILDYMKDGVLVKSKDYKNAIL